MTTKDTTNNKLILPVKDETIAAERTGVFAGREDEFYALLAEQTFLYTMGESSSVREESAKELIRGIKYSIELRVRMHGYREESLKTLFALGRDDIRRLANRGKLLLAQARTREPPITNKAYAETLDAIRSFFGNYNEGLFAHAIPCAIVYPLCVPVDENLQGIEYINAYLRALNSEADFLRLFSLDALRALYERTFSDYNELVVGLYAPAAEASVARALLCMEPDSLVLGEDEMKGVIELISSANGEREKVSAMLYDAAARVCLRFGIGERGTEYLNAAAESMVPRLMVLKGAGK